VKRVLVTGSGGFVGQILAEVLEGEGLDVWGVDRRDDLPRQKPRKTVVSDLSDGAAVDDLLDDVQPEYIVHLAAQSSAGRSFDNPHFTIRNNLLPALHILEYLRTNKKVRTRLLAIGSAEIYGPVAAEEQPLSETRAPNPVSPYALSKWIQEQCCSQYASLYDMDVVMTRSFNHTGAGQEDTFVLSSFAKQIVEIKAGAKTPDVYVGNIDVRRDFSDVNDVCKAYARLLEDGKRGVVYNVCSGVSHSLRELLERLATIAGVVLKIHVDKDRMRPVDIDELYGDNRRIAEDAGWTPTTPIEETLASLLDYWSARIGN
jgi:GDP-4-dehydro-6-deoxy-D-mannose reductase